MSPFSSDKTENCVDYYLYFHTNCTKICNPKYDVNSNYLTKAFIVFGTLDFVKNIYSLYL